MNVRERGGGRQIKKRGWETEAMHRDPRAKMDLWRKRKGLPLRNIAGIAAIPKDAMAEEPL